MEGCPPLIIKWSGRELEIPIHDDDTVGALKRRIEAQTLVQPKRQKLLGLNAKGGGLATDDLPCSDLQLKPGQKILMMGSPEADIAALDAQADVAPHIQGDFDVEDKDANELDVKDREENKQKLKTRIRNVEVKVLNHPRPGKKCLVLDIDYTIFDLDSSAERPEELARPHLHEFLTAAYVHYDLVIWSATNMKWIDVKMRELGVSTHPDYKLTCCLDHRAMVTVRTDKYGVFDCKPLPLLWAKFPDYNADNTIMIDDLGRNFVFNKQNGLAIRRFRKAHLTRATDRELVKLKIYLLKIAPLPTLKHLKHRGWESYIRKELSQHSELQ